MHPVRIRIDIACNDPDNGNFAGRAAGISIGDVIELEVTDMKGPRFREAGHHIVISGARFPFFGSKEWIGNWCWNAYWLPLPEAMGFLAFVRRKGKFSIGAGVDPMFEIWKKPGDWSAADKEAVMLALAEGALQRA